MPSLLQAGAVPFRRKGSRAEFLLVTSQRGRWIFPKGFVEPGETPEETALKEAQEEAGILGVLEAKPLGAYADRKSESQCKVQMYLMEYDGDCDFWEEAEQRQRRWCSYETACELIKKEQVRRMLEKARFRLFGAKK